MICFQMIWITHGPSTYNFAAGLLGLPTLASYVPHPLSASSDRMPFPERIVNVIWHHAIGIEFVNLPHSLLEDENGMFRESRTF
jgi:hypothetical protein